MKQQTFETRFAELMMLRLPIGFLSDTLFSELVKLFTKKKALTRREILLCSYMMGFSASEVDELLSLKDMPTLYVRHREDAVWYFGIKNRFSPALLAEKMFSKEEEDGYDREDQASSFSS